jgi:hypothetical protein
MALVAMGGQRSVMRSGRHDRESETGLIIASPTLMTEGRHLAHRQPTAARRPLAVVRRRSSTTARWDGSTPCCPLPSPRVARRLSGRMTSRRVRHFDENRTAQVSLVGETE